MVTRARCTLNVKDFENEMPELNFEVNDLIMQYEKEIRDLKITCKASFQSEDKKLWIKSAVRITSLNCKVASLENQLYS